MQPRGFRSCVAVAAIAIGAVTVTASPASAENNVTMTLSPARPHFNEPATFTFTGSSDRPARLWVTYFDYVTYQASGGQACSGEPASRASTGPGPAIVSGQPVDGPFSLPITYTVAPPQYGVGYHVCMWLAEPDSIIPGRNPIAPPTETAFEFDIPVVKSFNGPASTRVHSTFPRIAKRSQLIVSTRITSRLQMPQGTCMLERHATNSWLHASPPVWLDGYGHCRISVALHHTGRQAIPRHVPARRGIQGKHERCIVDPRDQIATRRTENPISTNGGRPR